MISPNSKGLFARAILESNPLALPFHTRESANKNAKSAFEYLGCDFEDLACMRSKSIAEILDAQENSVKLDLNNLLINFLPFAPMIEKDGVIPDQPLNALAAGEMASVPVLSGSMYDEGQLFVHQLFTQPLSKVQYTGVVRGTFGKAASQILDMYPYDIVPDNDDGRNALNVLATDLLFYCPLRNVTRGYQSVLGIDAVPRVKWYSVLGSRSRRVI
jgi:carboxylesterase type B